MPKLKRPVPDLSVCGLYRVYEAAVMLRLPVNRLESLVAAKALETRVVPPVGGALYVTGASIARYLDIPITNLPEPAPQIGRVRTAEEVFADSKRAGFR